MNSQAAVRQLDGGIGTGSWRTVEVGDLGEFLNGYAFKSEDWTTSLGDPIVRIQNLTDSSKPFNYFAGELSDRYRVHPGDLLVSWSASLDAFIWNGPRAWLNQHIFKVVPNTNVVDAAFLYFLMKREIRIIALSARGSTMKHVTGKTFRQHEVSLPPLDEQRRIARLLLTVQRAMGASRGRLRALDSIWRGALDRRLGGSADREAWVEYPFQEVIDFQEGPGIMAKDFRASGVPLIRLAGLTDADNVLSGCNYLDADAVSRRWGHFRVELGDTLLSTSASLGRVAVVDARAIGAIAYTGIIRMRPRSDRITPEFIRYLLAAPDFQKQAEEAGIGSVMRHFGPSHLKMMVLQLPPVDEQRRIVRLLRTIQAAQRSQALVEARLRLLFQAMLHELLLGESP